MKNKISNILNSSFLKNVFVLASGTSIAQLGTILFSPILSRLFLPEEFGLLALFLAIATFCSNISMFRYEMAIVIPKKDFEAIKIISVCLFLLILSVVFYGFIVLFFRSTIAEFLKDKTLSIWLLIIPLYILVFGFCRIINNWNNRKFIFKKTATGNIIHTYSNSLISVFLGYTKLIGFGALILSSFFCQIFELLYLLITSGKVIKIAFKNIQKSIICFYLKKYRNFLRLNTPHILVDSLRNQFSPVLITYYFSKEILGFYSFVLRVLTLPVQVIGTAISQVFYSKIANMYANGKSIGKFVIYTVLITSIIAFFPSIIIFYYGPDIFGFIFGKEWIIAGEYASSLSFYMFAYFISCSMAFVPYVLDKMKTAFVFSLFYNSTFALIIVCGAVFFNSFHMVLIGINILVSILYLFFVGWVIYISNNVKRNE